MFGRDSKAIVAAIFSALVVAGCQVELSEDGEPERGPIGKADLVGSCADSDCDGPAPVGNCYCDEICDVIGDCCADKAEVCEPDGPAPTCEAAGGTCLSSPIDDTFAADCSEEIGVEALDGACPAVNQACCAVAPDDELAIYAAAVDRIVDGRHVVILLEEDGRVVDEIVVAADDFPELEEGDRVLVILISGELSQIL